MQGWIQKLKDDQLATGANSAMLVFVTLPQRLKGFGCVVFRWLLRCVIIAVNFAQRAGEGKDENMEMMFSYLSGDEFRQRVEALVDIFESMHLQLQLERL